MMLQKLYPDESMYLVRLRWHGGYDTHEIPQIKPEGVRGHRVGMEIIVVLYKQPRFRQVVVTLKGPMLALETYLGSILSSC